MGEALSLVAVLRLLEQWLAYALLRTVPTQHWCLLACHLLVCLSLKNAGAPSSIFFSCALHIVDLDNDF